MSPAAYLLSCGWRREGSFPGGGDKWVDPMNRNGYATVRIYKLDRAEEIQLDRDAARRDYVNARRPVSP